MANNRMFLKCELCGEKIYLAKYYPSTGWYMHPFDSCDGIGDAISAFLEKHSPFPKRNAAGDFDDGVLGVNRKHGSPDQSQIMWGKTISLEYE